MRNLVVSGPLATGIVLNVLISEKKIPEGVVELLTKQRNALESGEESDTENLPSKIKACGLCRDISKYDASSNK